ncbi:metallophosphatase [Psychrobacillus phage Perkons]|nr:metallophosphatase [Psychrobacillus phage Perkons]
MTIWFTSDSHFFHKNILSFENRPFDSVEEMNEGLVKAWNNVVNKTDQVYHLGDFVFHKYDNWVEILSQLNGEIVLCRGNHDDSKVVERLVNEGYFKEYHEVGTYIKHNKHQMWLTHYPMDIGNRSRKWSISGHIHSTPNKMLNQVNIGCDSQLVKLLNKPFGQPISLEELTDYLDLINPQVEELFKKERGIE